MKPDLVNTASSSSTVSPAESGSNSVDALQDALRDREEVVTRMIESSQDCFKLIDLEGRLISVNSGGLQALGIKDFAPFRGSMWCELWACEFRETVRKAVETARAGGLGRFIGCYPTVEGTPKWWDVAVKAILDRKGRAKALLAILRDVTDSRRTENLLRAVTEGTASVTGRAFYESLVQHLATSLGISHAFVTECRQDNRARMRAFWRGGQFSETFEYQLEKP